VKVRPIAGMNKELVENKRGMEIFMVRRDNEEPQDMRQLLKRSTSLHFFQHVA
jgi:hypothetical protein